MGYDVHITRRSNWYDEDEESIPLQEWLAYLEKDQQMRRIDGVELQIGRQFFSYYNEGLSIWKCHVHDGKLEGNVHFDYQNGNIVVKNPDKETILKMIVIAERLQAMVQGDEGEVYDASYFNSHTQSAKPWWQFW